MRSLQITLYAQNGVCLPQAYNAMLQGALYSCWQDNTPMLHDQGFNADEKTYRLFTFSQIAGKSTVNREKKEITFTGAISFCVRSPEEDLIDSLAEGLARQGSMRIGKNTLPIVNISTADRLLFPRRAVIRMVTPVTLHRTLDDGYTEYLYPTSTEFIEDFASNCASKAAAFGLECGPVQLIPLEETLKKRVVRFKGTYVNGWLGEFILAAEPETMAFLYNAGLGARNSQGFGMFEIIDRPL